MKIALVGYGKMGKTIEEVARQRGHEILYRIDIESQDLMRPEYLGKADVAIEFSTPATAFDNINKCFDARVPVVCGSTGWLDRLGDISTRCREEEQSFLYSSNFSIGVNLFFQINRRLAELMNHQDQYEISMEEIHHTEKKDAPSGTAITLANQIIELVSGKSRWINKSTNDPEAVSIISKRIDPAAGTHIIRYTSEVDDIELRHTAHSRRGFASGAVVAAEWLQGKQGCFSMEDVLGI